MVHVKGDDGGGAIKSMLEVAKAVDYGCGRGVLEAAELDGGSEGRGRWAGGTCGALEVAMAGLGGPRGGGGGVGGAGRCSKSGWAKTRKGWVE